MTEQRVRMVDVSRYNGKTNLKALVDEWGVQVVIARCTIGHAYVDPYYRHNFEQSRLLGLLFGSYHVTRPQDRAPMKEVEWAVKNMQLDANELPDFQVADSELPNTPAGWQLIKPHEAADVLRQTYYGLRSAVALMLAIYTGSWWWNSKDHLGPATPLGIGQDFPLIEAEYLTSKQDWGKVDFAQAPEAPRMPHPGRDWTAEQTLAWQWTDGLRPIGNGSDGINRMDGNVLMPTLEQFLVLIGKTPQPTDKQKLELLWAAHPELHPVEGGD